MSEEQNNFLSQEILDKPEQNHDKIDTRKSTYIYAGISDRVKAIFADLFVLGIFMIIISQIFSQIENVPDSARIIAFVFLFFLYDPFFTSVFGGTIGHLMNGLRVRRENNLYKKIIFPLAIIRFAAKVVLGLISVITIAGNEKSRAIHDLLAGSVVIYKNKLTK